MDQISSGRYNYRSTATPTSKGKIAGAAYFLNTFPPGSVNDQNQKNVKNFL
ncbi:MAG: hypothetical protein AVDCRST_MAG56-1426 [uncultured Cytophagales bacterium]|uniref:Uncharacterized protein n=1 Tax=uncultured Cytophagales bacterium TaxID=158755 RepID=A0A6J4I3B3_9SPHI|nr:MAG: hypothetical protein AVDCRST_MAG56-1426 [uncultured Cytophagales bacterium]